eukprot:TRINITY_DN419_c0_g2_i1.p1 TRINITY_DN419_c0_g2~~TRINITY_DN419_c0_g2_i1.p1  ORF type:complete len:623 (-),score=161.00 TRINITY_DN419_c0_g2_i1:82-1950(-)
MNSYKYFNTVNNNNNNIQKLYNKGNKREDTVDKKSKETDFSNSLEYSTNLIIKEEEVMIPNGKIYKISLNNSKTNIMIPNNISPNEHRSSSKTQGITTTIDINYNNNTPDNKYINNFFNTNETNNDNYNKDNGNNLNNQQNNGNNKDNGDNNGNNTNKHKKAKKDLENSYNSLSIEDDDVDMNALDGTSCSNLALELLASCISDDRNTYDDMDVHIDKMFKKEECENLKKKRKSLKMQRKYTYIFPDSDKVKKIELFVLPDKVNVALSKNKFSPSFRPSHEAKYDEFLQKVSLKEFKLMAKEGPKIPKTWPDKLKAFPSATTYYAYAKNRYRDVLANEESRVRLKGVEQDYINANFIKPKDVFGRKVRNAKKFIACQAPIPSTLNDFWLMTWQQKTCVIVMLTKFTEKGVKKANSYWPKRKSETTSYGDFNVTNNGSILLDNLTITFLELNRSNGNNNRVIYHLHYTEWPDFGVPSSTLILRSLITVTDLYSYSGSINGLCGPIICHCSAGIGRTGTFIATHLALSLWKAEQQKPNVYEIVKKLRELRSGMVQSDSQYLFIYKVFNDYVYLSNHPKKSHLYNSLNSVLLLPDELAFDKKRKKAFLKKSHSSTNLHSLLSTTK